MIRPPALLFGVPVADLTMTETLELLGRFVEDGRATGRTHQVATVNLDFLVNAMTNPSVKTILQEAELCLADGMPIVWAAKLLEMPIRERVAGSDLVPLLAEAAQSNGWRVHIFGSAPAIAAQATELLTSRYPHADVSIEPGPMIDDVGAIDVDVLDAISAVDADILCVALGNPKQEHFIRAHRDRLGTPVMIGVGGSLDMLVGHRKRAPVWMQRAGLEWIARAAQEPKRLGPRYANDIRVFGPGFTRELRANRRRRSGTGLAISVDDAVVAVRLGVAARAPLDGWSDAAQRIERGAAVRIAGNSATPIDDASVAQLVGLVAIARRRGSSVEWADTDRPPWTGFETVGLTEAMVGSPCS